MGELNCYAAAKIYNLAETAHGAILHFWMDLFEANKNKMNVNIITHPSLHQHPSRMPDFRILFAHSLGKVFRT